MNDLISFYNTLEVDWPMLGFLMLFSLGVAIFHTVIFIGLFKVNLKPKWLFFALNPLLIGLCSLVEIKMGVVAFLVITASVFICAIFGMVYAAIISSISAAREDNAQRVKSGKSPVPLWLKFIYGIGVLGIILFIFSLGVPYFILIIFVIIPFITFLKPTNKKRFYKIQRTLPTANIRSVSMGLAEISGTVKQMTTTVSKLKSKPCIGFLYTVEDVKTDKDGKDSYHLEHSETYCKPFYVEDATGKMKVLGEEIEFIDFEIDEQYRSSGKRYTQYLLLENMQVLMIGKASVAENNEPVFEKEQVKNVFGIAPISSVDRHNKLRPVLQSAAYFAYFWVILIALIFLTPMKIKNNTVEIGKISLDLPFKNSKPVESVGDFYDNIYDSYEENPYNKNNYEADTLEMATPTPAE